MIRSFIALKLPGSLTSDLAIVASDCPVGRPVAEDDLHLTLAFLGDQPVDVLEEIDETLSAILFPPFELGVAGLSTFGSEAPRTLWAGVRDAGRATELHLRVRRAVRQAGLTLPHRRFVPHITLARFGRGDTFGASFERFIARHAALSCPVAVITSFALVQSNLRPDGPVYEVLSDYRLG